MNKKGAELPMNTLIAAIIAIVVLLLIITFFTGGLGTIGEKVRDIFGKSTAGYDVNIAKNFCTDYCNAAKRLVSIISFLFSFYLAIFSYFYIF